MERAEAPECSLELGTKVILHSLVERPNELRNLQFAGGGGSFGLLRLDDGRCAIRLAGRARGGAAVAFVAAAAVGVAGVVFVGRRFTLHCFLNTLSDNIR